MVLVETTILVPRPLVRIALKFVQLSQRRIIPCLHEDLVQQGI